MSEPNQRPPGSESSRPDEGVEELVHRVEEEFGPDEGREAVHRSHEEGGHAALRQRHRWVLWLLLGGIVAASVVADWRFAFLAVLLMLLFALPSLTAAAGDSGEDAERESLEHSIEDHDRRGGDGAG